MYYILIIKPKTIFAISQRKKLYEKMLVNNFVIIYEKNTILVNVVDDKWNWTWKALAILNWAMQFCPSAEFIIHSREDITVDLTNFQYRINGK